MVIVTGASRGIGLSIASSFAKEGKEVLFIARNKEVLEEVTSNLNQEGYKTSYFVADISKKSDLESLEAYIKDNKLDIDILINNAGVSSIGLFQSCGISEWEDIFNTNVFSAFALSQMVIPQMVHKKHGHIINISSIWGEVGASCESIYASSKGAINAFSRSLGKELAPSGITVNAISCGMIDTEMNGFLDEDEKNAFTEDIPTGRMGTPEDVANLALFLASEKASYITGKVFTLDGGYL